MNERLICHGGAICEHHTVERLDGSQIDTVVHNIREMKTADHHLEAFIKDEKGARHPVVKYRSQGWQEQVANQI